MPKEILYRVKTSKVFTHVMQELVSAPNKAIARERVRAEMKKHGRGDWKIGAATLPFRGD